MRGFAVYTLLRLGLLLIVWFLIQLATPLRGLIAIAAAFAVSGIIGFFLLDRPRNEASVALSGVFKRIDDRIEKGKAAEDAEWDDLAAQRQAKAEQEAVTEGEQAGDTQDGDEISPSGTVGDQDSGSDSQGQGEIGQPGGRGTSAPSSS